jgi:hypothetical protein
LRPKTSVSLDDSRFHYPHTFFRIVARSSTNSGFTKRPRSVNGTPGASGRSGLSAMFTAWLSQARARYALAGCWALTRVKLASPPSTALSAGQTPPPLLVMAFASLAASTSPSPTIVSSSRSPLLEATRPPHLPFPRAPDAAKGRCCPGGQLVERPPFHTPWCEVRRLLIVPPPRPLGLRDRAVGLAPAQVADGRAR